MNRILNFGILIILAGTLSLFTFQTAKSQLSITIEQFNQRENIDPSGFPFYKFKIKATLNGSDIALSKDDVYVIEENKSSRLLSLSSPVGGWQNAVWETRVKEMDTMVYLQIFAVSGRFVAGAMGSYRRPNYSVVWIASNQSEQIEYLHFGKNDVGATSMKQIYVIPAVGKKNDQGFESTVSIDSITFTTPYFSYNWQGHPINKTPPPVKVFAGFQFLVDIKFTPVNSDYVRDIMTIHFDGGAKKRLFLTGNKFDIENNTSLKLLQPNGEELFAPCDDIVIKWKGHNPALPISIEFSSNNGNSWQTIAAGILDSAYNWKAPDIPTDDALIRVRQNFDKTSEMQLLGHSSGVTGIAYNAQGTRIISADTKGRINEYELISGNRQPVNSFYLNKDEFPSINYYIYGIDYIVDNQRFAIAYYDYDTRSNKISFFKFDSETPEHTTALPTGLSISEMQVEPKRRFISLTPSLGAFIILLDPSNGSVIGTHDFSSPVMSLTYEGVNNRAAVALLDGSVRIISLENYPSLDEVANIDLSYLPIIIKTGLSSNGKYLSVGCKSYGPGWHTDIHVVDIASQQIIRSPVFTYSDPLDVQFNPASTNLVSGSAFQPQIQFWNLPLDGATVTLSGHSGMMSAFKISPNGHSIASGGASSDNLYYRSFTYPEFDDADTTFRIVRPIVETTKIEISEKFIDTDNQFNFNTSLCNIGETPFIFYNVKFKYGIHFKLAAQLAPDTLFPGECLPIPVIYNPRDTGTISDSLIFSHCTGEVFIPVKSFGLPRNLYFFNENVYFGEVCIDETETREFDLFRNEDPVPVRVNGISLEGGLNSPFKIIEPPVDSVVQPGGIIRIKAQFKPKQLGNVEDKIRVFHSNQLKMLPFMFTSGKGIGTFIDISPNPMPYIPELKRRYLVLKNTGETELVINKIALDPINIFRINSALPLKILPHGIDSLEIEWYGDRNGVNSVVLDMEAVPCLVQKTISLRFFDGGSQLSIPAVSADVRGEATIPINYTNSSNYPYLGERFFEAEISMNPRLFLPFEVSSVHGLAEITRNEVVSGRRYVKLRVEGNFPEQGTLAEIKGIAGLAETDTTALDFVNGSLFWGAAVNVLTNSGKLQLTGLCDDRRIIQNDNSIKIVSVNPNPANENITIIFEQKTTAMCIVEIYDNLGNRILATNKFLAEEGINTIELNIAPLAVGNYRLMLRSVTSTASAPLSIIR